MKVIYKYQLVVDDGQSIELPLGAEILTVQTQKENPVLWVLIDPEEKGNQMRHLELWVTGHKMYESPYERKYIGTFQLQSGNFVGHLFEILPL